MRMRGIIIGSLVLGVVALVFVSRRASPSAPERAALPPTDRAAGPAKTFKRLADSVPSEAEIIFPGRGASDASSSNVFQRMAADEIEFRLTPEQIADYLRRYGTNVETLLGTQSREYLKLAADLFPNDPRVQYAVITRDLFPEAKREWIERFKKSAPDNPVANYLSAREYLREGNRERGLQDLLDASAKTRFDDYILERWQNAEEAQLSTGRSIAEAKFAAGISLQLPQLAMFKNLAQEIQAMQKDYLGAGDSVSAERLARIGHQLAQQLIDGDGSRPLINQLVGAAIDRIVLSPLPGNSEPDFLDGPVQEHLDERSDFRKNVRALIPEFDAMLARGDAAEITSFFDRMKLHGEYKAMQWLQSRAPFR